MVTFDQGVATQGNQSLKHAPNFWGHWSRGRSRGRAKSWTRDWQLPATHSELFRYQTLGQIHWNCLGAWIALKLHQCIANLETLRKTFLFRLCCTSLVGESTEFASEAEKNVCVSRWDSCGGYSAWIPQGFHTCVLVYFFFPCGITGGVCD